ncbi:MULTISPECIES: relaxase/mobilization nuclease [unclassified Streptomyces]|uniref:relaxase/mobilization nuclease n=1 Tax=unclassified Streptomyces TaxID=2593676 RepID=UPI002966DD3F|nr:relaxase/mobilization nuclease [Streptomyces sp. SJL17-1]
MHARADDAGPVLSEALGRSLCVKERLTGATLVAWWPGLEAYAEPEPSYWTLREWAEHLDEPSLGRPGAASVEEDRRAIFRIDVRLAPGDRSLTRPEWSEIAHRFARAARIEVPGDEQGCRWIAVQAQPGRLDLIANLVRRDGSWQPLPSGLLGGLAREARRLEADLGLISPGRPATPGITVAAERAAMLLTQVGDETSGPLAGARDAIEHLAQRLVGHPQAHVREAAHRLEWTARRLVDLQQDLTTTATVLSRPSAVLATAPAPGVPAHAAAARTGARPVT